MYSWLCLRCVPPSRSIWVVYMCLTHPPLRPICISCANVANGAFGRTFPTNVLPFLRTTYTASLFWYHIWVGYMCLTHPPLRPICISCANVANGAFGWTFPTYVLPFLRTTYTASLFWYHIWVGYMCLTHPPLRPICISYANVANNAFGWTSLTNVLPFLHTTYTASLFWYQIFLCM